MAIDESLVVEVRAVTRETDTIQSYELSRPRGEHLPAFSPGAHIDVQLEAGMTRSYSLINCASERTRYVIAVDCVPGGRGGSRWIHGNVRVGQAVSISVPRNRFPLETSATHSVLIAGGIGITPLLAMMRQLERLQKSWELHYCVRDINRAAFLTEMKRSHAHGRVTLHLSGAQGRPNLDSIVRSAPAGTHFYCCGPTGMLQAFEQATACCEPRFVHTERFTGEQAAVAGNFDLVLANCGRTLRVNAGETILERLILEGFDVPNSCREGVCGSCEVPLIAGKADHRDMILTAAEKAANTSIFVCCSGSLTQSLTLRL
jgi:ferredoxin-NADP reductase